MVHRQCTHDADATAARAMRTEETFWQRAWGEPGMMKDLFKDVKTISEHPSFSKKLLENVWDRNLQSENRQSFFLEQNPSNMSKPKKTFRKSALQRSALRLVARMQQASQRRVLRG